jgi:hypothetical protein
MQPRSSRNMMRLEAEPNGLSSDAPRYVEADSDEGAYDGLAMRYFRDGSEQLESRTRHGVGTRERTRPGHWLRIEENKVGYTHHMARMLCTIIDLNPGWSSGLLINNWPTFACGPDPLDQKRRKAAIRDWIDQQRPLVAGYNDALMQLNRLAQRVSN